jgi:branched-chain amino acid transport system substrate-binding protein
MAIVDRGGHVCGDWAVDLQEHDTGKMWLRGAWLRQEANARRDVADPSIGAILGTYTSGMAAALLPIVNEAGLLVVSPSNTMSCLTVASAGCDPSWFYPTGVRNYARVIAHDVVQGKAQGRLAAALGARTAHVIAIDDTYGITLAEASAAEADQHGIATGTTLYSWPPDLSALDAALAAAPDVIVIAGFDEAIDGTLALRFFGFAGDIIIGDGALGAHYAGAVGADARVYGTIAGSAPAQLGPEAVSWAAEFTARYGVEPNHYTPYAYAAATHILDAMDTACAEHGAAPTDRDAVRDAGLASGPRHSILGDYEIDANGDITNAPVTVYNLATGAFLYHDTIR